nr:MAG TPA: hypothetical protein [Bacteriophage sp.]DAP63886.1 MAG TPA: hypothetical protein [Caudoviricetes sp.]
MLVNLLNLIYERIIYIQVFLQDLKHIQDDLEIMIQ